MTANANSSNGGGSGLLLYLILGTYFGIVLVKSEAVSWFRIQEMFRFQSIHMYGLIGSAVVVAALSLAIIKRSGLRSMDGKPIEVEPKPWGRGFRYWLGGTVFGLGWGLLGACPGPIFALVGSGVSVMLVALASALVGAWVYGALKPRLPH